LIAGLHRLGSFGGELVRSPRFLIALLGVQLLDAQLHWANQQR
jgi:hypothetical protein